MNDSNRRARFNQKPAAFARSLALTGALCAALLGLFGCVLPFAPSPTPSPTVTATDTLTPSPAPTATQTATATQTLTPTHDGPDGIWGRFAAPREKASTPIPPPMPPLVVPDEMQAVILAGLDKPNPYPGRSDALILLLYHPRLSKAALISIPPDLFGYLPGETMQRLYAAYPLGGAALLQSAIEYNLGIRPNAWVVGHIDDFPLLIDEFGGLNVSVLQDIPNVCGDILYQGEVHMNGAQVLCYARLREGSDEAARGLRQQQILRLMLDHMVRNGNLTRVNDLFTVFRSRIDTNLTLLDALKTIPLALRLGDPSRVAYFQIGPDQTSLWQMSEKPPAQVFLPRRDEIRRQLDQAVEFVSKPSPLNDIVVTLEFQLTHAPLFDIARTPIIYTPRPSRTPTRTITPTFNGTVTAGPSPTRSTTPTRTITPTPTPTPTLTNTFAP